jgi:hypothetical protein
MTVSVKKVNLRWTPVETPITNGYILVDYLRHLNQINYRNVGKDWPISLKWGHKTPEILIKDKK